MRIKQSLCYPMYLRESRPLDALCQAVAAIGYAAIELWGIPDDLPEVVATARRHGLVVASMIGHGTLEAGLNNEAAHDGIEAELRRTIDLAAEHGVPGLICFSGNRRQGQSDSEGAKVCAKGFKRIAPYAEKKGVNLNLELLNSKVDHPGYQCDHTAWGAKVVDAAGSPRVKLLYDIYHMQIMEGDIIRTIREHITRIGHFHTAGNPGRHDMDDTQEMNYRGICRAIAETGYDLYLGHEFSPHGEVIEALKTAFEICDQG